MITVDLTSAIPPFEQIRVQLARDISSGALVIGTRLPTVRRLAQDLGIANNTVLRAYQELESAGLVEAHGRAGTIVSAGQDQAQAKVHAAATAFAKVAQQTGIGTDHALRIVYAAMNPGLALP